MQSKLRKQPVFSFVSAQQSLAYPNRARYERISKRCECGAQITPIGKKFIRQELEIIPKQVYRVLYYTVTYAYKECQQKTGEAHIAQMVPPRQLLEHSLASPSAVADVMTQKYVEGIPLVR